MTFSINMDLLNKAREDNGTSVASMGEQIGYKAPVNFEPELDIFADTTAGFSISGLDTTKTSDPFESIGQNFDLNNDGRVNRLERLAAQNGFDKVGKFRKTYDLDGDGKVTNKEINTYNRKQQRQPNLIPTSPSLQEATGGIAPSGTGFGAFGMDINYDPDTYVSNDIVNEDTRPDFIKNSATSWEDRQEQLKWYLENDYDPDTGYKLSQAEKDRLRFELEDGQGLWQAMQSDDPQTAIAAKNAMIQGGINYGKNDAIKYGVPITMAIGDIASGGMLSAGSNIVTGINEGDIGKIAEGVLGAGLTLTAKDIKSVTEAAEAAAVAGDWATAAELSQEADKLKNLKSGLGTVNALASGNIGTALLTGAPLIGVDPVGSVTEMVFGQDATFDDSFAFDNNYKFGGGFDVSAASEGIVQAGGKLLDTGGDIEEALKTGLMTYAREGGSLPALNLDGGGMFDINLPNIDIPRINLGKYLPDVDLPDINLPDIDVPRINLGDVYDDIDFPDLPDINLPEISVPDIELPSIDIPRINLGDVYDDIDFPDLPDINVPDINLPNVSLPDINVPDISLPNVSLPDINVPDINLPNVSLPDINVPNINLPNVSLPDINVPNINLPDFEVDLTAPEFNMELPEFESLDMDSFDIEVPELPELKVTESQKKKIETLPEVFKIQVASILTDATFLQLTPLQQRDYLDELLRSMQT